MANETWIRTLATFREAAVWFVDSAERVDVMRLDDPGLGEWTVRDLIGHTSRSLLTVESYLDQPATATDLRSPVDYFRWAAAVTASQSAAIAQRGRDAGADLGVDLAHAVRTIANRVLPRVEAAAPDDVITTPGGGMRLADYLPTRTFELTVHTCDLAAAVGLPAEVPERAARECVALIGELAVQADTAAALIRAATGRGPLPDGFTVL